MTLEQLKGAIASYVTASKQAGTWTASTDNIAKLVDKIAKTVQIDGIFTDKLNILDGEALPLGKTVEEYYQDLDSVLAYSSYESSGTPGEDALKPYYPTYRPASYNYTLGRKIIPTTLKYDEYEKACNSAEELQTITNTVLKRLYDTFGQFKYDAKKQMLANFAKRCIDMKTSSTAQPGESTAPVQFHASSTSTAASKQLKVGDRYFIGANIGAATNVAIAVKARAATSKTWAEQIAEGYLVELNLVESLAMPVDTLTGEAFVTAVKKGAEDAQFVNEGNSLNGNTVGAENGLVLIVKKGVKPVLDVEVEAGAFNPEKLAVPAEIVVVDDFGNDTNGVYAILMDKRACRLHPSYMAVREQVNGIGDFVNYFLHTENTAFISKNCFVKIFKTV